MGPEGTEPGAFTVYCDVEQIQEIPYLRFIDNVDIPEKWEWGLPKRISGTLEISQIDFDRNAFVAELPVEYRYLWHCVEKGWKPSERGLLGFMKLLRLGYYKTL